MDVPPKPLPGLSSDATSLAAFLGTIPGPVVLVGHSYAGAVITNAVTRVSNVKALVYVDAFAPDEGETVVQLAIAGQLTVADFIARGPRRGAALQRRTARAPGASSRARRWSS